LEVHSILDFGFRNQTSPMNLTNAITLRTL
jgi:hypothetical protein